MKEKVDMIVMGSHGRTGIQHLLIGSVAEKVIRKEGGKWVLYSSDGKKKLGGPYKSRKEAQQRLRQVEYYKNMQSHLG